MFLLWQIMYYLKWSKTKINEYFLLKHLWKEKMRKPQDFLLSQRASAESWDWTWEWVYDQIVLLHHLTTHTQTNRVWLVFAEQTQQQSLPSNFPLVRFCRLLCELFPSAESETVGSGEEQNEAKRTLLPLRLLSWLNVRDPEGDTSRPEQLTSSPTSTPTRWPTACFSVRVSRGPEWQTSIQPEAETAGYQATPLDDQLTCCLAAGMDGWLWMLLPACLFFFSFFYSLTL